MTEWIGIGEMARRAGVSVRTLRHYDAIGLLAPTDVTQVGYRRYDEKALARLEQILYFRELGFALEEIAAMVNHPDYDAMDAMHRQRELLCMQRARLDAMIARLDEAIGGKGTPRLEVLDMSEIEKIKKQYADEAKARWGGTDAYAQSEKRTDGYSKDDWQTAQEGMNTLMREFAVVRDLDAMDERVQALVARWQQYITDHFYDCTDEILAGLGQMYVCDERFRQNIDHNGEGTAACMSRAIAAYCAARRG
ncbi:MAG: MerR family transcriptional regulator [Clostridiales bacterium]|nr:MerR family transcriptional regulator [Clostridiales bacterium]